MLEVEDGVRSSIAVASRPFASSGVAGQTPSGPGMCAKSASGFCEWNGPPENPPPDGSRSTIGTAAGR